MNNFNLIENTKSRNMKTDLIMAGGLASSMMFFVMKSQKNKIYFLRPSRKDSEEMSTQNEIRSKRSKESKDSNEKSLMETRSILRGKRRLGTLSVKKSEILINLEQKDGHLKEILKQKPRLSIPQNVFSENDLKELKELAQGKEQTWVVEECHVGDDEYQAAMKKLAGLVRGGNEQQKEEGKKQIEFKEEDLFNRVYWMPPQGIFNHQQTMLNRLLVSANINVLLSVEEDGQLQGSMKLTLKLKEDLRSDYPEEDLLLLLSAQKIKYLWINGVEQEVKGREELSKGMIRIGLKELRMGLNNIQVVYIGELGQNGSMMFSKSVIDCVPSICFSSLQVTLAYLLPASLYGFNSTKETVDQIISPQFQSRVLDAHKHIIHHTTILGKRLQIFRTPLPSQRPSLLLLHASKQTYQKENVRIYDQMDGKAPFTAEFQRSLTGYVLDILKNVQEVLKVESVYKVDIVLVEECEEKMGRDGVLIVRREDLESEDRLVWLWKVMSRAVQLQMRGRPTEKDHSEQIRHALSMYFAYDYIHHNQDILNTHSYYPLQSYIQIKAQQQFISGQLEYKLFLVLVQLCKGPRKELLVGCDGGRKQLLEEIGKVVGEGWDVDEEMKRVFKGRDLDWDQLVNQSILDLTVYIESEVNPTTQQYDLYDLVIDNPFLPYTTITLLIINDHFEVSYTQNLILKSQRNTQLSLLNKHQQNVIIYPIDQYIRPIISKPFLLLLMNNFSRIKDKSLTINLLMTVIQKYFLHEMNGAQALEVLCGALEHIEDDYYLLKIVGYMNTMLVQQSKLHLEIRKEVIIVLTKRLKQETGSKYLHGLVREINKLVVFPQQYQLVVNLQLEVDIDKTIMLPLVLRQYHLNKDYQVKQNYLVCFEQKFQQSLQPLFASCVPEGIESLLDFIFQNPSLDCSLIHRQFFDFFYCLIKDNDTPYILSPYHLQQLQFDNPLSQLIKIKRLISPKQSYSSFIHSLLQHHTIHLQTKTYQFLYKQLETII